jgi:hypothetical protein
MWIGCGDNIIEVDTIDYKYDLVKLKKTLKKNKGHVMCAVVYVGEDCRQLRWQDRIRTKRYISLSNATRNGSVFTFYQIN